MAIEHTIISASPRAEGTCVQIALELADAIHERYPEDGVSFIPGNEMQVNPCLGCNECKPDGICIIDDHMPSIREALDQTTQLIVVSPVYFAGPPAQYKALLDRLQPYYWHPDSGPKRLLSLVAVGDGGDPHGYDPLVTCTRSAFACAGFQLDTVVSCIGMEPELAAVVAAEAILGPSATGGSVLISPSDVVLEDEDTPDSPEWQDKADGEC